MTSGGFGVLGSSSRCPMCSSGSSTRRPARWSAAAPRISPTTSAARSRAGPRSSAKAASGRSEASGAMRTWQAAEKLPLHPQGGGSTHCGERRSRGGLPPHTQAGRVRGREQNDARIPHLAHPPHPTLSPIRSGGEGSLSEFP